MGREAPGAILMSHRGELFSPPALKLGQSKGQSFLVVAYVRVCVVIDDEIIGIVVVVVVAVFSRKNVPD